MALKKKKDGIKRGPGRPRKILEPDIEVDEVDKPTAQRIVKWRDEYYVLAYRLARQGMTNNDIMAQIGVRKPCFIDWKRKRPALVKALEQGRSDKNSNFQASFRDYVYRRLSPELQELWDEINRCERKGGSLDRIEAMFEKQGKRARQHLFLYALVDCNFNASEACRRVNITTMTLRTWTHQEPEFRELMDEMNWHKGNLFEEGLIKLVREGDTKAIVFANERFNRGRGYGNKVEVNHSGQISHSHTIDLDGLDLDPETKIKLLEAVRKQKQTPIDVQALPVYAPETDDDE